MKIWRLQPIRRIYGDPWEPWYDKAFGFVVRAETEDDARRLANDAGGDETGPVSNDVYRVGGDPWLDPAFSTCDELVADGPAEVVLTDFWRA